MLKIRNSVKAGTNLPIIPEKLYNIDDSQSTRRISRSVIRMNIRQNRLEIRWIVVCAVLIYVCAPPPAAAETNEAPDLSQLPFAVGEKLTFKLRWGFFPAGRAVLEVLPPEKINGEMAHHFVLTVRTNSFVDAFYRVRQRIDAYCDLAVTRSILYKEVHSVRKTKRDSEIRFDWENMKAQYVDFGQAAEPIQIKPGAFDPLSAFYFSRTMDPSHTKNVERPVTDGKKCVMGRATVVKRQKIKLWKQRYDTFLVEPELAEVGGVFEKDKNAKIQIWVTADHRRIPVQLKSKVSVGSFVGALVSAELPTPATSVISRR
ncbi:hypothetical protein D3OALGA1CA_4062 [Olavius algarvensis associated proteobacterium Delta 3]|nr:hypothetical protein D3OALGA1CA_4062 [Olavius algarvensis associated proteobacterium Delta 3]